MIRNSIEVSIPTNIPVRDDGIVEVPINATDLSFCGGFTIHIAYDRNLLQIPELVFNPAEVQVGDFLKQFPDWNIMSCAYGGTLNLSFSCLRPISGAGTIAMIRFKVPTPLTGPTNLTITGLARDSALEANSGDQVGFTFKSGSVVK